MAKIRKHYLVNIQIMLLSLLIISCSLPKIVVYQDPLTPEEHNNLGVIYESKGKLDLAEKEYKKAIKKDKNWYLPYFNLGNIYYKKGELEKAEEFYKKSLERKEDLDTLNNLAYVLYLQGKYKEAMSYIEKVIKIKPEKEYLDTYNKILEKLNPPHK